MKELGSGVVLLLVLAIGHAQDAPRLGAGPLLTAAVASEKDGKVLLEISLYDAVPTTIETTTNIDGKITKQVITRLVAVEKQGTYTVDGKKVQVLTADGKPVEAKRLLTLLARRSPVLLSQFGKVDPAYLALVKDGTLLVVISPE